MRDSEREKKNKKVKGRHTYTNRQKIKNVQINQFKQKINRSERETQINTHRKISKNGNIKKETDRQREREREEERK